MATHSSILAWEIPWTQSESGGLQSHKESDMMATEHTEIHMKLWRGNTTYQLDR